MADGLARIKPALLARLFNISRPGVEIALESDCLRVGETEQAHRLPYRLIHSHRQEPCHIWDALVLEVSGHGPPSIIRGFRRKQLEAFRRQLNLAISATRLLADRQQDVGLAIDRVAPLMRGLCYPAKCLVDAALATLAMLRDVLSLPEALLPKPGTHYRSQIDALNAFAADSERIAVLAESRFIQQELEAQKPFFDAIEEHPLTARQRLAIVTHQDNTLVIAGAGSGKTSVIVTKASYLIRRQLAQPEQILILAYNREAAWQIKNRLKDAGPEVTTFHALGLSILSRAEQVKPSVSPFAHDNKLYNSFIRQSLLDLAQEDSDFRRILSTYFQSFFASDRSPFDFDSYHDYQDYVRSHDSRDGILTLKGERCKSFEECEIANFLALHGIDYRYEQDYEHKTGTRAHRQYKPDFSLYPPDGRRIYLEHFALDANGQPPPHFDGYLDSIDWKRQTHQYYGTTLLETYSWQKKNKTLLDSLKDALIKSGFQLQPTSTAQLLATLKQSQCFDDFSRLLGTFLNHYKNRRLSPGALRDLAMRRRRDDARFRQFIKIFHPVLERYEAHLKQQGEIDFNDMISRAAQHCASGRYLSPYTCILVDEFQDISASRASLIKALRQQSPTHRLFCVGDDWQSIYRFSGSDIAIMRNFSDHFGTTITVYLDKTFRFNDQIEAVATPFILKNQSQLRKTIETLTKATTPSVHICPVDPRNPPIHSLLADIQKDALARGIQAPSVGLLARYHRDLASPVRMRRLHASHRQLRSLEASTIHAAKGKEWDYVILLGLHAATRKHPCGFPTGITDDPLIDIVLASPEGFPHAEERRLFYVALTRARHAVYLVSSLYAPSPFTTELTRDRYPIQHHYLCPACRAGYMTPRRGKHGPFYGCSEYPACQYTQ